MTSNYSTIDVEKENNRVNKCQLHFNTLRIYITLNHTYFLLNCRGHIQMTSNYSTIDVQKENNRVNKCQLHI